MNLEESNAKKRLPVAQLRPGMYVVELDKPWFKTPFFSHSRHIKNHDDIELLAKHGIGEVVVDLERSVDAGTPTSVTAPAQVAARELTVGKNGSPTESPDAKQARLQHERILQPLTKELSVAHGIHAEALATAQSVFDGVGRGSRLNSPAAKQTVTELLGSVTRSPEANLLLAQMRRFQNDLFTHAVNVCVLSLVVATLEGFSDEVHELGLGALLHDIGQVRLPRNLLRKNDSYTDQERRLMEQHPALGAAILEPEESIPASARRMVMEHHERLNGTGYPQKIGGESISLLSQIVSITDAYDAMIIGRNGIIRRPIDVLRQLYLDANAGAFSRDLVEKVIRSLGVYPVGSLVELNTGERGIVLAANRSDTLRPTIRLVLSRDGLPLPKGPILSLAEEKSLAIGRQIVRSLDPGKERIDIMSHLTLATGLAR
jgi:HD-GYP domain-containing protein (c-di-GMP phosphodiesterase class II)